MKTDGNTLHRIFVTLGLVTVLGAGGCRQGSDDALGATRAPPSTPAAADSRVAPAPEAARSGTRQMTTADPPPQPEIVHPEATRPEPIWPRSSSGRHDRPPVYPRDAGAPKEPPDAVPLSK